MGTRSRPWIGQQDPIAYQVIPEAFVAQVGNLMEIMSYKGAQSDPPALGVANRIALVNASLGTIEGLRPGVEYWVAAVPFPTDREYEAGARTRKGVEIIRTVLITTNDPVISAAITWRPLSRCTAGQEFGHRPPGPQR